jgi:hypothetical protein
MAENVCLPAASAGAAGLDVHAPPVPLALATATSSPSARVPSNISTVTGVVSLAVPENVGVRMFDGVAGVWRVTVGATSASALGRSGDARRSGGGPSPTEARDAGAANTVAATARSSARQTARTATRDVGSTTSTAPDRLPPRPEPGGGGDIRVNVRRHHRHGVSPCEARLAPCKISFSASAHVDLCDRGPDRCSADVFL